jgi:hypothetical protein
LWRALRIMRSDARLGLRLWLQAALGRGFARLRLGDRHRRAAR